MTDSATEPVTLRQTDTSAEEHRTRQRLLSEAERVFAAQGYEGASVRQVTRAAGANVAAVSYYFGGKEGLYRAVFERFFEVMRERRIQRIEADMEAAGDDVTLEAFLQSFALAFLEPLVEDERGQDFMSLFDQEMRLRKIPSEVFFERLLEPMLSLFMRSLERTGVDLERPVAALCLMSLVGQLTHAVKASRRFAGPATVGPLPLTLEAMIPHIVFFSAGGIRSCAERVG